jgi:hypothetical protein
MQFLHMHPTKSSDHHSKHIHESFSGTVVAEVVVSLILVNVEEHPVMPGQNGWRISLAIVGPPKISHNRSCILTVSIPTSLTFAT